MEGLIKGFYAQIAEDATKIGESIFTELKIEAEKRAGRRRSICTGKHGLQKHRDTVVKELRQKEEETANTLWKLKSLKRVKAKHEAEGKPFDEQHWRPIRDRLYGTAVKAHADHYKE
jgi:F0F1-type ATP synthase membrane subunit b/b'